VSESKPHDPDVFALDAVDAESEEELREVRAALDDLRREIRERFGRRETPPESTSSIEGIEWEELLTNFSRWISTIGMSERSAEVDEFGMDEVVVRRSRPVLDLLFDRWWRVDLRGLENLPQKGPCLLVANRSGLLPWDGLLLAHAIERFHGARERPRFFVADWLMTLPFVQPYLARLGGVRACRENAERLLEAGRFVIVFPEGAKGATKSFRDRYRLQRFGRGGVIRVALETGVPLVPVGIVGAEEAHPILFKWSTPARAVGLPFLPVTPTFPLLGPLGVLPLPSKWEIRIGAPIPYGHLDADAVADELLLSRLTEELRAEIARLVRNGLDARESVWS
jgi:1-acyl-sn-glycerol-3-phosphate acyltransferase